MYSVCVESFNFSSLVIHDVYSAHYYAHVACVFCAFFFFLSFSLAAWILAPAWRNTFNNFKYMLLMLYFSAFLWLEKSSVDLILTDIIYVHGVLHWHILLEFWSCSFPIISLIFSYFPHNCAATVTSLLLVYLNIWGYVSIRGCA